MDQLIEDWLNDSDAELHDDDVDDHEFVHDSDEDPKWVLPNVLNQVFDEEVNEESDVDMETENNENELQDNQSDSELLTCQSFSLLNIIQFVLEFCV
ncbi:hypothetical protein QTP88_019341 [Uroleucon formosanum]